MSTLLIKKIIRLSKRYITRYNPIKTKVCCICDNNISDFLAHEGGWKNAPSLVKTLQMMGSDIDNFACPVCYSHDRERHQWLYWQAAKLLPVMHKANILHFAPEPHLSRLISQQNPSFYIKADLYPTAPDIQKVDILAIPFANNNFDIVIANHVLEHVDDVDQALIELHRILRTGGMAILQTPYSSILENTWEDAGIKTPLQRLTAYGQEDHVRLFGQDIFTRIEAIGFSSLVATHNELLPNTSSKKYGVNLNEPFMLFQKQNDERK